MDTIPVDDLRCGTRYVIVRDGDLPMIAFFRELVNCGRGRRLWAEFRIVQIGDHELLEPTIGRWAVDTFQARRLRDDAITD